MVSIILTFIIVFNWNMILREHRLMENDLQARSSGSIWKLCHFTFHRSSIGISFADCWMQIDRNPTLAFSTNLLLFLSFSHLFVCFRKLVATFFIRTGREHFEHRLLVTTTAPMMASLSMLSRKRGWLSWKNTSAKVQRNQPAPMESTTLKIRDYRKRMWFSVQQ